MASTALFIVGLGVFVVTSIVTLGSLIEQVPISIPDEHRDRLFKILIVEIAAIGVGWIWAANPADLDGPRFAEVSERLRASNLLDRRPPLDLADPSRLAASLAMLYDTADSRSATAERMRDSVRALEREVRSLRQQLADTGLERASLDARIDRLMMEVVTTDRQFINLEHEPAQKQKAMVLLRGVLVDIRQITAGSVGLNPEALTAVLKLFQHEMNLVADGYITCDDIRAMRAAAELADRGDRCGELVRAVRG